MQLKKVLVLVVLAGVVAAATAQGIDGSMLNNLASGDISEQNAMVLAGLALLATIVRRSVGRNS